MADYKVVHMGDRTESLPGRRFRELKRAEILIDDLGPFVVEVENKEGWEHELRAKCQQEVQRVRTVTT